MHEFSIVSNLIEIIEEVAYKEGLNKINTVNLVVGKMRQVVPETMQFVFEAATKDTKAENARLEIEIIPVKMQCNNCSGNSIVCENVFICPECYHTDITLITGKELFVKSIKGEKYDGN